MVSKNSVFHQLPYHSGEHLSCVDINNGKARTCTKFANKREKYLKSYYMRVLSSLKKTTDNAGYAR